MAKLARFVPGNGGSIGGEADGIPEEGGNKSRRAQRDRGTPIAKGQTQAFQPAMHSYKPAAEELAATFLSLARRPSGVEIQLGLKLSGEAGAIIASTSAEGNISVKLTWDRDALSSGKPEGTKTG